MPNDCRDVAPWSDQDHKEVEAYQEEREAEYADMEAAPSEPY